MSITITNYIVFQLSNYDYNKNYFKNVINCNWLQLQITTTTSLMESTPRMHTCKSFVINSWHVSRLQSKGGRVYIKFSNLARSPMCTCTKYTATVLPTLF